MTQGGPRPAIAMAVGQGPPYGADMPLTPQEALQRTIEHREIFHDEMVDLMRQIMRAIDPGAELARLFQTTD